MICLVLFALVWGGWRILGELNTVFCRYVSQAERAREVELNQSREGPSESAATGY